MDEPFPVGSAQQHLWVLRLKLGERDVTIGQPSRLERPLPDGRNWAVTIEGVGARADKAQLQVEIMYAEFPLLDWA